MRMSDKSKVLPILIEIFAILFLLTTFASAAEAKTLQELRAENGLAISDLASMKADMDRRGRQMIRPSELEEIPRTPGNENIEAGQLGIFLDKWDKKFGDPFTDGMISQDEYSAWMAASGYMIRLRSFVLKLQMEGIKGAEADPTDLSALFKGDEALCSTENPNGLKYYLEAEKTVREGYRDLVTMPLPGKDAEARKELDIDLQGPSLKAVLDMLRAYPAELARARDICQWFLDFAGQKVAGDAAITLESLGIGERFQNLGRMTDDDCSIEALAERGFKPYPGQSEQDLIDSCKAHVARGVTDGPLRGVNRPIHDGENLRFKPKGQPERAPGDAAPGRGGAELRDIIRAD